jgi:hypothetical protein
MKARPQPFSTWRLVAATGVLVVVFLALDRAALLPTPTWPGDPRPGLERAADVIPPEEVRSGQPILSLVLEPEDLHDPARGLLANPLEYGRDWERAGHVAFFDGGRLRFATGVGVRVHGGGSRRYSTRQGFRLYFRRSYGARQVPPGVLFSPAAQPIRHLVVHNDVRDRRHFVNPLAYDLARAIGAITPETYPVRLFVNGELYGAYVLTERFDQLYFATHFGHGGVVAEQDSFNELWGWTSRTRPLSMATVAAKVDLDSLTRWFLSVAFSATGDAFQGPGQFLDLSTDPPRWFWVNWDMDGSFRLASADSYRDLLNRVDEGKRGRNPAEPRATLLTHLFAEDEAFRAYYKRLVMTALNHQLTPQFLERRFNYYRRASERLGVEDARYLRGLKEFLDERPAVFWKLTEQWLNTPSHPIVIVAPPGEAIAIDGISATDGFSGRSFADVELELQATVNDGARFKEWRVNGELRGREPVLRLTLTGPSAVEAVFEGRAAGNARPRLPAPEPRPAGPERTATPLEWMRVPPSPDVPGFDMLAHEVSSAQFEAFTRDTGRGMPLQPDWSDEPTQPVVNVTWPEAQAFCGVHDARLPTQAEWEYAADWRERPNHRPPWGDDTWRGANLLETLGGDRWMRTSPVGSFPPNRFGLYDMIGNVWEWTSTVHERSTPSYEERIVLGGSWDTPARRFPRRTGLSSHGRYNLYVGFRCVR